MSCDLGKATFCVTSPTSQLIHKPFCSFTYVTALLILQPFPSLHLRHNSFSNPSFALPTSQSILQPFRCFTYVTSHSPTLLSLVLRHRLFTYVTLQAAHEMAITLSCIHKTSEHGVRLASAVVIHYAYAVRKLYIILILALELFL